MSYVLQKLHMLHKEQSLSMKAIFDGQDVFLWLYTNRSGNRICYQTLPFLMEFKFMVTKFMVTKFMVTGYYRRIEQASN